MDQPQPAEVAALHQRFVELLGADARHYPARLEAAFPRILAKVVMLWGSPALDAYLNELMVSERHDRQGFPDDVAMEIFHLSNIHAGLHLSDASTGTGWAGIQDPEVFRKTLQKDSG
ncbi:MAG: hypothetical protein F9K30_00695 [Dechloromonas sp.]|nr:MAG: hypothetical protein F9K30_00695 [Dechloromonas sp.]